MKKIVQVIKEVTDNHIINENDNLKEVFNSIRTRIEDNEFKIVVAGEFSSGKSTFINALIGKDILKHATNETTATITYIHNVKKSDELCGKCKVNYSNGETKCLDSYDNLREYTTAMSAEDVVNTIESVEIFMHFIEVDAKLTIIDTPGLNGTLDKHREVTVEEIKMAHACIYVFQKNGVTKSDEEFIKFLCNYQNTFIFIQNFIDELRKSEGDSIENKVNAIKTYLNESLFTNKEVKIEYSIHGISALKALAGKDNNISKLYEGDLFDLTEEQRKKHLDESNVKEIEEQIIKLATSERSKEIKYKSACHTIDNLLKGIILKERKALEFNNERLQDDDAYKDKEEAIKSRDDIKNRENTIVSKLNDHVIAQFSKNEKLLNKDIEIKLEEIEEKINNFIDNEIDYENFDSYYKSGVYANELQRLINLYKDELEKSEYYCVQDIYRNMLNRLSEYSKSSTKKVKSLEVADFVQTDMKNVDLTSKEKKVEIEELKMKLANNEANKEVSKENLQALNTGIIDKKNQYDSKKMKLQNMDMEKNQQENKLGKRPEKYVEGYDTYETYEDRDGLVGGFAQFFVGKKKVTKSVPRYNDNQGLEWDRKKREISTKYQNKKEQLHRELESLKEKQTQLQIRIDKNKNSLENSGIQINFLRKQISAKEEDLRIFETKAKKEYLMSRKNELKTGISTYLFREDHSGQSIGNILKDKVKEDMSKNKELILKEMKIECRKYIKGEIERLDAIINGNVEELNKKYISNEKYIKHLETICKRLREEQ